MYSEQVTVAFGYLVLAIVLAVSMNAQSRWMRAAGTLLIALGLAMIVVSIILADLDGTFTAIPASASLINRSIPAILNLQAAVATAAIVFLGWSAWQQTCRLDVAHLAIDNTVTAYGRVSRYFHWTIAVLMFCLVPIGLFMAILPPHVPERADFVAAHQALGLTVFVLTGLRLAWLLISPPPAVHTGTSAFEAQASRGVHGLLYLMLLLFPVSGYLLSAETGAAIDVYGWKLSTLIRPGASTASIAAIVHNGVLPIIFYSAIAVHAGAVLKRHFRDDQKDAIRRMLR
jgi:cytochrome b561